MRISVFVAVWMAGLAAAWAGDAASASTPAPQPEAATTAPAYETIVIANEWAEAAISTDRGIVERFALRKTHPIELPRFLREQAGKPHIPSDERKHMPLAVLPQIDRSGRDPWHGWLNSTSLGAKLAAEGEAWTVEDRSANDRVALSLHAGDLTYRLTYALEPGRPTLDVTLEIANGGAQPVTCRPFVTPIAAVHQDYPAGESYYLRVFTHEGGANGTLTYESMPAPNETSPAKSSQADPLPLDLSRYDYAGVKSRFFAAFVRLHHDQAAAARPAPAVSRDVARGDAAQADPAKPTSAHALFMGYTANDGSRQAALWVESDKLEIAPSASKRLAWDVTITDMRAMHLGLLSEAERRIEYTDAYYKFFRILAKGMTWLLDLIYLAVHNYGVAVVVMTVLVKAALHRTSVRQQTSIMRLQQLAPQMKALQEQLKDNRQQLAMKQMELYKKHGVNPLGGCLPMFIQIPIFIALYQSFSHSSEMRGQRFLWVDDMTLPDVVFGLHMAYLSKLTINPLPLLYIAVTVWMSFQQKPPANADPQQEQMAKMMRWMPVFFGLLFYNMPAGLVLYFTTNALLSTLEMRYIKAQLAKHPIKP